MEWFLDRWLLSCLTQWQENSQFSSWHLILPSLSTPCSFFQCWRRPQRKVNCFEQVEQENCWSTMLLHSFPAKSEVNLTAASHALFHLCNLAVHLILYITCSYSELGSDNPDSIGIESQFNPDSAGHVNGIIRIIVLMWKGGLRYTVLQLPAD